MQAFKQVLKKCHDVMRHDVVHTDDFKMLKILIYIDYVLFI